MKQLLFALLLFTSFIQAQNNTAILGKVLDDNEKPIEGAKISIIELSLNVLSDENGNFKFENIEPKTYNFVATASGFEEDSKFNIIIKSAGNSDLIFNLKPFSNKLEEVKIVSNPFKRKKESPLSIQSLSDRKSVV